MPLMPRSVYYAHCVAIYGTPQEARDIAELGAMGFAVQNPNSADVDEAVKRLKGARSPDYMEFFRTLVEAADVFAFRALPDGRIPAGVFKELEYARHAGKPVLELPGNVLGRSISVEETREYLREVGQR